MCAQKGIDMRDRRRLFLAALVCFAALPSLRADETLRSVYADILEGRYERSMSEVARLKVASPASPQVERVDQWLQSYREMIDARTALREKTFEWNMARAGESLAADKLFLALRFAAQAQPYAADADAFPSSPLIQSLRDKCLAEARKLAEQQKWSQAQAFAVLLLRVDPDDEQAEELAETAGRFVRLEVLYSKDEDIQRRIENVDADMLKRALSLIRDQYFEEPDFRKMAEGALDNVAALCRAAKLYDSSRFFDGVANPASREHFLAAIERLRTQMNDAKTFGDRDLWETFVALLRANKDSCSLPEGLLVVEFTEGALARLDPFTSVIWPADSTEFDKMMVGTFYGVGIQLGIDELTNRLKVVTPLENSPALREGVQPDDLIVAVDGESTVGWDADKAIREITGEEGTKVTLTLFRPRTGQSLDFELTRSKIQLTTVRGVSRTGSEDHDWNFMLDPSAGVAYIRLTGFNPDSHEELHAALDAAKRQGMRGLILDLRYNPGGLLDVAVETVSLFVREGEVVSTKGRKESRQSLSVSGGASYADLPLVVLVNEASASASEILAGAMQDHSRAAVLGERTFGKGSVQRVLYLDRNRFQWGHSPQARLKLTTALYYLPSGRSPHKALDAEHWGVDPDWKIVLTPKEITRNFRRQNDANIIHNEEQTPQELDEDARKKAMEGLKDPSTSDADADEHALLSDEDIKLLQGDPIEAPDRDPQLETALLQLRVKLAAGLPWPELARRADASRAPSAP